MDKNCQYLAVQVCIGLQWASARPGGVHQPSLETEMSQLIGFRWKRLCPTEQGALIPLITGAAKPELKEQKFFVHGTNSGLSVIVLLLLIHPMLCQSTSLLPQLFTVV